MSPALDRPRGGPDLDGCRLGVAHRTDDEDRGGEDHEDGADSVAAKERSGDGDGRRRDERGVRRSGARMIDS
ncbi:MAG: hypothetical protein CL433_06735 [Acidimicrobiaceae bacterium]|nr:hypothetical protein [Acidimicrobiaceae bacterium]HAB58620.1 hypothetical protein [Acidimicrobiaceae bacterium]